MNINETTKLVAQLWDNSILPVLCRYIEIPAKSPYFDANWEQNGYLEQAIALVSEWIQTLNISDLKLEVHRLPGRTPLLLLEIPGQTKETVLLYGHLDKQPEMTGWHDDLGPWKAVIKEDRLYGRGAADDGYAVFSSLAAIKVLQQQKLPHPRCLVLIETCEESGSFDLPYYMEHLKNKIGEPSLVIGLDSGAGNYEQLWNTTSLRGIIAGVLTVEILNEGVHSGNASGIVPSSFRLLRQILDRVEDEKTGKILLDELDVTIPPQRINEAKLVADTLKEQVWDHFPWVNGAKPENIALYELVLNRTWRSTLSVIGISGIPALEDAGNVLHAKTSVMLSFRIPPLCDPDRGAAALKQILESDPPYGAKISFSPKKGVFGWNAPAVQPWLADALNQASQNYYGKPMLSWGEGATIPFIYMLGQQFPQAQFLITGVIGPHANAHGPNEFLHLPMVKKLTCCVAEVLYRYTLPSL